MITILKDKIPNKGGKDENYFLQQMLIAKKKMQNLHLFKMFKFSFAP